MYQKEINKNIIKLMKIRKLLPLYKLVIYNLQTKQYFNNYIQKRMLNLLTEGKIPEDEVVLLLLTLIYDFNIDKKPKPRSVTVNENEITPVEALIID